MKQVDLENAPPALNSEEFVDLLKRQFYLRGHMGLDIDGNVFTSIHLLSIFEGFIGEIFYQDRTPAHFSFPQILHRAEDDLEGIRKVMNYPLSDMTLNRKPVLFLWDNTKPTLTDDERGDFDFEEVPTTEFHFLQHCARMAGQVSRELAMTSLIKRHGGVDSPAVIADWSEDFIVAMRGTIYRLNAFIDQQNRSIESAIGSKIVTPELRSRFDPQPPETPTLMRRVFGWIH